MFRVYLLVTWRIGDDEVPLLGAKEAVGDIDRDALLPLRLQAVDQQRQIQVIAGRTVAAAVGSRAAS